MKWKLYDFQADAVGEVLERLAKARADYHSNGKRNYISAFALSATTGAGKTVMATAVFEALFFGSEEYGFEADKTAVVLWVTDDPSLNEQTRDRIIDAGGSDPLGSGEVEIIGEGFEQEVFDARKIYFLNIQKLSTSSTLVRRSNKRHITLWDTIRNTIHHPHRTLYLVIDEAHRGMRKSGNGESRPTIVQKLIRGHDDVPPAPIVWGISATIERFDRAMREANALEGRILLPNVVVPSERVQESGLLKDTICLAFPDEKGDFETVLLRTAVKELLEIEKQWNEYAEQEKPANPVVPLLVVQVPNTPSDTELIRYLDVIYEAWEGLPPDAVANVFGERKNLNLGKYAVPYIEPQRVHDTTDVRVLLAKDAISTGWDCPRAEVMISFRGAQDPTYITQLLGRMVRTPLAQRIESNEKLNSVTCVLPHFNRETAIKVAEILTGDVEVEGDIDAAANKGMGRRVLLKPVNVAWNSHIPKEVRDVFVSLPTEAAPKGAIKPIRRLLGLAAAFAIDKIREDPDLEAREALYSVMDGLMAQHQNKVKEGVEAIYAADVRWYFRSMSGDAAEERTSQEVADERTVADAFRVATRSLGTKIANGYVRRQIVKARERGEELDFMEAQARLAALVGIQGVVPELEEKASKLADEWLEAARTKIKMLTQQKQATYREFVEQSNEPKKIDIVMPGPSVEEFADREGNTLPLFDKHVISNPDGKYPFDTSKNKLEAEVLKRELERGDVVAWYRNPSRATPHAVRVPYETPEGWKSMQPDFIFFHRTEDGTIRPSLIDPHSAHLSDALPKLKGLARFAELYGSEFARIDAINKVGDQIRVLDMTNEKVREAVLEADGPDAEALYTSDVSAEYL